MMAVRAKDPAAVALGSRGGKKGGHARAAKLTSEERSAISRSGALARWHSALMSRPHNVVRAMLQKIAETSHPQVLIYDDGTAYFVEEGTPKAAEYRDYAKAGVVGVYGPGATFSEAMADLLTDET
jgi:hypothetical protein